MRGGGEDDQGGDGHGQEEDEKEDAVQDEGDLLPLQGELLPRVGLHVAPLVGVDGGGDLLQDVLGGGVEEDGVVHWKTKERVTKEYVSF